MTDHTETSYTDTTQHSQEARTSSTALWTHTFEDHFKRLRGDLPSHSEASDRAPPSCNIPTELMKTFNVLIETKITNTMKEGELLLRSIEEQLKLPQVEPEAHKDLQADADELVQSSKDTLQQNLEVHQGGHQLQRKSSIEPRVSSLVIVLSDVFQLLRELKIKEEKSSVLAGKGAMWTAPDSFERSTSKYWVNDSKLSELLLMCVKEAPLLVYDQCGPLSASLDALALHGEKDFLWDDMASKISSVYFDSPKLDLYRERIARKEGAQLLRARWYGKRPKGNEPIFLELKTHHESWVNQVYQGTCQGP